MGGPLTLKCASAALPSGEWGEDNYDVLADGKVVGRIVKAAASPVGKVRPSRLSTSGFSKRGRRICGLC
jgi:hypothetical protein